MTPQVAFGVSVALSFVAWGITIRQYLWPVFRQKPRADALRAILLLHSFRFVGLAFLVPGVVSPSLPRSFAGPAAYGDLVTALLALLSIATFERRLGVVLIWAFNLLGTADLLRAFYEGNRAAMRLAPGLQGAAYFIATVLVPLLLITHGIVFRLLLQRDAVPGSESSLRTA
jgi:hypothetical protein